MKLMQKWDIDLSNNYIKETTKNYTTFLGHTSKRLSSAEIIFAMTQCMRLYSWLGTSLYQEDFENKYKNLKDKLSGSIDLSLPNIIPDTIENFLV